MKTLLPSVRAAASLLVLAGLSRPVAAQIRPERLPEVPVAPTTADDTTRIVDLQLLPDSLVVVPVDSARLVWLQTPPELRDLVGDRIGCFETDAPHAFQPQVMTFVRYFTERNRKYMQRVLERENLYFPLFEKYLAQYNLPTDLKYLAVVESALIPTAKSPVGATGLWQFMGPTAGDLRLRRDEWVDERMNPEKATEGACKHLRYLYGVFHDWELVLAAYNWGAGNMQRVMRRTGKKTFWELYPNLPAETRNYVPTFTAVMYSMKYAQAHQLHSPELNYRYAEAMDTLQVGGRALDLCRLSQACGYTDSAALLRYNPELRRTYLPAGYRSYAVQVPVSARPQLAVVDRATLFEYCQPQAELPKPLAPRLPHLNGVEPFPTRTLVASNAPHEEAEPTPRFRRVRHTVRRGESVAAVAGRYSVTTAQLSRWNGLRKGQALTAGKQLVVFVPVAAAPVAATAKTTAAVPRKFVVPERLPLPGAAHTAVAAAPVSSQPAAPVALAASSTTIAAAPETVVAAPKPAARVARATPQPEPAAVAASPTVTAADDSVPTPYTVRRGDNLSKLAQARGLSVADVIAWNKLASEKVMPGQKINFYAPSDEEIAATFTPRKTAPAAARLPQPQPAKAQATVVAHKVHLVQPGDTLYNISRRYEGVTVEQLRQLNNLTSDNVKPGQKLIVAR